MLIAYAATRLEASATDPSAIASVSYFIAALWLIPSGIVACYGAYEAAVNGSKRWAVTAALSIAVSGLALFLFSFGSSIRIPVLLAVAASGLFGWFAVNQAREFSRSPAAPSPGRAVLLATTLVAVFGLASVGISVIIGVTSAVEATLALQQHRPLSIGGAIPAVAAAIVGIVELHLATRAERTGSRLVLSLAAVVAASVAVLIWLGSGRLSVDAIAALTVAIVTLWPVALGLRRPRRTGSARPSYRVGGA
jgi:hypothetical protein